MKTTTMNIGKPKEVKKKLNEWQLGVPVRNWAGLIITKRGVSRMRRLFFEEVVKLTLGQTAQT